MCTAITFSKKDFYFGRTLDLERTPGEEVVITPRNFPFSFLHRPSLPRHYAIIGMAHVASGYPLYYDGVNEAGLCMAGLNFPEFARYQAVCDGKDNVASFEFLPWVLGQCKSLQEARNLLLNLQLTGTPFGAFPSTPLHWIIADRTGAITVEPLKNGLQIHENPVGVLTNSPPFDDQMFQLSNYMHLSADPPQNHFAPDVDLRACSGGMGAIGLPGDLSSQSRFVRASFTKLNSVCTEEGSISQFFHILDSVHQARGCCRLEDGACVITQYTSCYDAAQGIYYYNTYGNRRISAVDMNREDLETDRLFRFPLEMKEDIRYINSR